MKFVLPTDKTPILVQGITGSLGATHAEMAIVYGSHIVAGVAREKGLKTFLNVPVFQTVREAVRKTKPMVSMVFSTPARALADVTEAAQEKIPLIICTTEHISLHDRLKMIEVAEKNGVRLLGPSSPGVVSVDRCLAGTMPAHLFPKGSVGIVSRSSSLTYEAVQQLSALNVGVSSCVALGTSTLLGTSFIPVVQSFLSDAKVKSILVIGDLNGNFEFELASWYKTQKKHKPIVVYISGKSFPKSKKLPFVGASSSASAEKIIKKQQALEQVGAQIVRSPELIGQTVVDVMKQGIK